MDITRFATSLILACFLASNAVAVERHVPGDYTTIGAAIYACSDGDAVIVHPGTYTGTNNRDISFMGKAITVRSIDPDDPAVVAATVIDCQGGPSEQHRGFYFHTGEGPDSVLAGLTIKNGYVESYGGGIYCEQTSPTIVNCMVRDNVSHSESFMQYGGGGIACFMGSPAIRGCRIVDNTARWGGGISLYDADPTIVECAICGNSATSTSSSGGEGGGINCFNQSRPTIINCMISGNSASGTAGYGGGIHSSLQSEPTLVNCAITGNWTASSYPSANPNGAGIYCSHGVLTIQSCTFSRNSGGAASYGGAIYCYDTLGTLADSILWADGATKGPEIALMSESTLTVTYSDVEGGEAPTYVDISSALLWGAGNINLDPLFVDTDGPDDDPATWEDNDFHLSTGSPCIDTGDPAFVAQPGETDIDGQARVWDAEGNGIARVDMGSDEFGSFVYGDLNCDGVVNAFDIDPFVLALTDPEGYLEAYPDCDIMLADINADGKVDAFDIDPFVELLIGG